MNEIVTVTAEGATQKLPVENKKIAAKIIAPKIIGYFFLTVLAAITLFNLTLLVKSLFLRSDTANLFGFRPLAILSGSMTPHINYGDLIVDRDVNAASLKKGDVITYSEGQKIFVSHRIIDITQSSDGLYFKTQGDANNVADSALVSSKRVLGKCVMVLPYVGYVSIFGSTIQGQIVLIMAPIFLFFIVIEVKRFVKKRRKNFRILKIFKAKVS